VRFILGTLVDLFLPSLEFRECAPHLYFMRFSPGRGEIRNTGARKRGISQGAFSMSVARQIAAAGLGIEPDLLQTCFDAFPDCLLLVENERILFANPACTELLQYERSDQLAGQPVSAIFPRNRFCHELLADPQPRRCEHPACEQLVQRAGGEQVPLEVRCSGFRYGDRPLVLIILRERQGAELSRTVRDSELRFRAMFEGAAIGISICNLDGRMLEVNPAVARMLGYSREELVGMHPRELHPGDFAQDETLIAELMSGVRESFELDKRYRRKDGSYLWGHLTVSTVRAADHEPKFLIAMLEDTTERRRLDEQLREAEKMEVIGRLAGGVAHDFNNLLTGILLYCDLLSSAMEPDSRLRRHVEEVRMAGEQGAALTQQLLAIARKQVPQPRPILVNEVVASTENLLRRLVGEQIQLVTVLGAGLGKVLADQAQLRQILLNLVLNARDAMPHGGRITVRTEATAFPGDSQCGDARQCGDGRQCGDARQCGDGRPRPSSGAELSSVSLSVEDNGCGMDAATRARLFEPFFTTKEPGHGTGLGLATVRRIVEESRGLIRVQSEPDCGTRIEVVLPAIQSASEATAPPRSWHAGETILLVDDHAPARKSMQRILYNAGYRVLNAPSGKRALEIFADHSQDIDLLVADWMMPGMNGRELADTLRRQNPGLRVLLISGYHDDPTKSATPSVKLIRKPFSGTALIERIREVLDSRNSLVRDPDAAPAEGEESALSPPSARRSDDQKSSLHSTPKGDLPC
jgi:two-component system, cell cycle sensor histidine kinase and response regulator CckA